MMHSSSVKIRKRHIIRAGDMFHMNNKFKKKLPPKPCISCKRAAAAGRPVNPIHGLKFLEDETDFANVTLWVDTLGLTGTPIPNKILGDSREIKALRILKDRIKGTDAKIERERYLRDCKTRKSVRDKFGSRRRVDFVIIENNFGKCYEVTGPETDKTNQMTKEKEIRKK